MTDLTHKILWYIAAACVVASAFYIGSLSWACLQVIALWLVITRNNAYARIEIARLKNEILALKTKVKNDI